MKKYEVLVSGYKYPSVLVSAKTKAEALKAAKNVMIAENYPRATIGQAREK